MAASSSARGSACPTCTLTQISCSYLPLVTLGILSSCPSWRSLRQLPSLKPKSTQWWLSGRSQGCPQRKGTGLPTSLKSSVSAPAYRAQPGKSLSMVLPPWHLPLGAGSPKGKTKKEGGGERKGEAYKFRQSKLDG